MIGVTEIDGKEIRLKASAGVLVLYKSQFGSDYIEDSREIYSADSFNLTEYLMTGYRLLWCMAKIVDPAIPPPDEWIESFKVFELEKPLKKAQELFSDSLKQVDDIEQVESTSEPLTVEKLIAYSALCGMTLADLDRLPLPMVLSTIYEYIRLKYGSGDEEKTASQADYDNF